MKKHWSDKIAKLDACGDAVEWLRTQPDAQTAWDTCERGDWMLWLLGNLSGPPKSDSRRRLVLCTCAVAREVLHLIPEDEDRPRVAIETAERWARGEDGVTLKDVRRVARAAEAAAEAAYAAGAAAEAANAAWDADAAAYAACAAGAAAYAACAALLKRSADIVREHYPEAPDMGKETTP